MLTASGPYLEFSAAAVPEKCDNFNFIFKFHRLCLALGAYTSAHCCLDQSPGLPASKVTLIINHPASIASWTAAAGNTRQTPLNSITEAAQLSGGFDCSRMGPLWPSRVSSKSSSGRTQSNASLRKRFINTIYFISAVGVQIASRDCNFFFLCITFDRPI